MKTIQPVTVWFNGQQQQAAILDAYVSADNLSNRASFAYQLLASIDLDGKINLITLASGYLDMTGVVYENWTTNEYAYDWVAEQLNLTITGEYVPPAPSPEVSAEVITESSEPVSESTEQTEG